jgi:aspartyl-tRNA(Asn)/glutamyl-tRNA(Gln) amidotransferase subunit C
MIDPGLIRKISSLARLDLDDDELSQFTTQLGRILEYFELLNELDTSKIEPAVYPVDIRGPERKDEEQESPSRESILANTTHKQDGFYVVPKVLE